MSKPKVFSHVNPLLRDTENNLTSELLVSFGYLKRCNPAPIDLDMYSTGILYVPNSTWTGIKKDKELLVDINPNPLVTPECSAKVLDWAYSILKEEKLPLTPYQLSVVFSIYGYDSSISSSFIISGSKHPLLSKVKVPVLDMSNKSSIEKLKELLKQ